MGRKAREALVPRCPKCGGELLPGVAHQCLVAEAKGITVSDWWKPFLGIILALVLQLGGAIWWARRMLVVARRSSPGWVWSDCSGRFYW